MATYISVPKIVSTVERYYHLDVGAVRGRKRQRRVVQPRQVAMYLSRELTGFSLFEIGSLFHRDHSTVIHGINTTKSRMGTDPELSGQVRVLRMMLSPAPPANPICYCTCVAGTGI